jgi:hypothetical protein
MSLLYLFLHYAFMDQLTGAQKKDLKVLIGFIRVYCGAKHVDRMKVRAVVADIVGSKTLLCGECAAVAEHALEKRRKCPLDPKPSCKKCRIHCYGRDYRVKIRGIMAFSGRCMIMRGRLDYLWHYLF